MGASVRPITPTHDDAEFEAWKARNVGNVDLRTPADTTSVAAQVTPQVTPVTHDDAEFQQWKSSQATPAKPQETAGQRVYGVMSAIGNGLTFGAGDKLRAGVDHVLLGTNYDKALADYRGRDSRFAGNHPGVNAAMTAGGAVAGAMALPLPSLARGASLLGRVGAGALEGAGFAGGAAAVNSDGSMGDRARAAAEAAPVGALLGGALPVAGKALGALGRSVLPGAVLSTGRADNAILRSLDRDQTSIPQLRQSVMAAGNKPVALADLAGENTLGLARAAQAVPSKAKSAVADALNTRHAGQLGRVAQDVEGSLGMQRQDVYDVADQLIQQRKDAAKPLYEKAYSAPPVDDPEVADVFKLDAFRKAHQTGQRIAATEGVELPDLFKTVKGPKGKPVQEFVPQPVQSLDYVKRGLDDVIERGMRGGKMGKVEARALRERLSGMLGKVDAAVPDYAQARQSFAGHSQMMDALENGRTFLKDDARVTTKSLDRMSDGEKDMYRVGAIDAIRQAMDHAQDGADLTRRIFGTPEKRAQLQALIGDDTKFADLEKSIGTESRMAQTKNKVLGNSVTARLGSEIDDMGSTPLNRFVSDATQSGVKSTLVRRGLDAVNRRRQGVVGKVADELSGRLTATGPDLNALLDALEQKVSARPKGLGNSRTATRALIGTTSGNSR
jgi:hypothetical protein